MPLIPEFVVLVDGNQRAEVIYLGAYFAKVRYSREGIDYEVVVTNDEYEYWEGNDIDDTED